VLYSNNNYLVKKNNFFFDVNSFPFLINKNFSLECTFRKKSFVCCVLWSLDDLRHQFMSLANRDLNCCWLLSTERKPLLHICGMFFPITKNAQFAVQTLIISFIYSFLIPVCLCQRITFLGLKAKAWKGKRSLRY
jgi:hypothetical protein